MHALIVGPRQVGKSTLIQKVISDLNHPVWGFNTKREDDLYDEKRGYPIYIYPADSIQVQGSHNLLGFCHDRKPEVNTEIFENFAKSLQTPPGRDSIILMDELGFMESHAEYFKSTVLKLMDGDIPIVAAVKEKSTPFLDLVKNHPNCKCFFINEENRDELTKEVAAFLKNQY